MTINEIFETYDVTKVLNKGMAMDLAGDMHKLNDSDFVAAWKMVGTIGAKVDNETGVLNCLSIHPHIVGRMTQIFITQTAV